MKLQDIQCAVRLDTVLDILQTVSVIKTVMLEGIAALILLTSAPTVCICL